MKVSSYNCKWLIIYTLYFLCLCCIALDDYPDDDYIEDFISWLTLYFIAWAIIIPLFLYMTLLLSYNRINNKWIVKKISKEIDFIYQLLKKNYISLTTSTSQKEGMQEEMEESKDKTEKEGRTKEGINFKTNSKLLHWLWKIFKVLFWIIAIGTVFVLAIDNHNLRVPMAIVSGYIGVKMFNKPDNK